MVKLIDNFSNIYNDNITINVGTSSLTKHDEGTDITLTTTDGKTIRVTKKKKNWPLNIKIEVEEKDKVDVSNPQNCKIKKCEFVNHVDCWCINPLSNECKCFCFDLSLINENKVTMNEIGATVTVGDEGVGAGKKKKKKKALKNL